MDKAKTLEVLRGMKFMQRKEEAKRRATFEVAQREEIERQLHGTTDRDGTSGSNDSNNFGATSGSKVGTARAKILYDDACPTSFYTLSRRAFTDALGAPTPVTDSVHADKTGLLSSSSAAGEGVEEKEPQGDPEDVEADLWSNDRTDDGDSNDDSEDIVDPTAAPPTSHANPRSGKTAKGQDESKNSRFFVKAAVRAPKLPRRLEESVAEEERQRKQRRAEEEGESFA